MVWPRPADREPADRGVLGHREPEGGRQLIERDEVRAARRPERQRHALAVRQDDGVGGRGALRSRGRRKQREGGEEQGSGAEAPLCYIAVIDYLLFGDWPFAIVIAPCGHEHREYRAQ